MLTTVATALSYLGVGMVVYYLCFFLLSLRTNRRAAVGGEVPSGLRFVVVVPAHDEELVIEQTVRRLRTLQDVPFVALVMNDGSRDATSAVARAAAEDDARIVVVDRPAEIAGQGKGEVLNHAFRLVTGMIAERDPRLDGASADDVVLCVVDADGWLEPHALREVAPYFAAPDVGGVQLPVRMWNAAENFLALMQDMEFLGFSKLVQAGRDPVGSVGLGGNGQFVRVSALQRLGRDPWTKCLTEDLDLTMSLIADGWRIRFCPHASVAQQALTSMRPLLRQRARWIQGHYSCWGHVGPVLTARGVPLARRLDAAFYLVAVVFVVIFAGLLALSIANYARLTATYPTTFEFIASDTLYSLLTVALTVGPIVFVAVTYRAAATTHIPAWAMPGVLLVFTVYGYLWAVPATVRALTRLALRRGSWAKTERLAITADTLALEAAALRELPAAR